jgi:hypothetical protein
MEKRDRILEYLREAIVCNNSGKPQKAIAQLINAVIEITVEVNFKDES